MGQFHFIKFATSFERTWIGTSIISTHSTHAQRPNLAFPVAFAALIMGAVAMGISPVFVRLAEVGPFASAFWRVALAVPALALWAAYEKAPMGPLYHQSFTKPILLAGIFFSGDLIFWHLAILNTTLANATLMACLAPVWVILFSGAFIGEPVPRQAVYGLGLCLLGAALLIGSSYQINSDQILGDVFGVITSMFFGLYFLAIRVARRALPSGLITLNSTIVTTAILLCFALLSGDAMIPQTLTGYLSLLSLGLVSHVGGQGLLTVALGSLSAAFSSLVIFMEAVTAAIFGWLVFSEKLTLIQLAGAMLILAGIWIARPAKA